MALKDWKRVRGNIKTHPPTMEWNNSKTKTTLTITGWKTYGTNNITYDVLVNQYDVPGWGIKRVMFNGADRKRFDSRTKAITFARNYMYCDVCRKVFVKGRVW